MFADTDLAIATTDVLEIGYFEPSPGGTGKPVAILLHGWPDDPHSLRPVADRLVASGWRVILPFLRGYGPTVFRHGDTERTGDPATLADDVLDLADALGIDRFAVVGHDWGARAAYTLACAAPERIAACAALAVGWGPVDPSRSPGPAQIQAFWYQWFMGLERGGDLLRDPRALAGHIWNEWCVRRHPDAAFLDRLCESFRNPDWSAVVLHYYRTRWGLARPSGRSRETADRIAADPVIRVPALCVHGGADPCVLPETSETSADWFSGPYRRIRLDGIGHFPQFEVPRETGRLVADFLDTVRR